MEIEDKKFQVKSYNDYKRQFIYASAVLKPIVTIDSRTMILQPPPEIESPKNILKLLNDDCLIAIFRKLHFSTLNTVMNVCIRFNRLAKRAFFNKYRSKKIHILELKWNRRPTLSQVEDFLIEFGSSILSLSTVQKDYYDGHFPRQTSVVHIENEDFYLKIIDKYCKNLNELEFSFVEVNENIFFEYRTLFQRLKKLQIRYKLYTIYNIFDALSICSELESLEIDFGVIENNKIYMKPKVTLPKLVELRLLYVCELVNRSFLPLIIRFLELNPQLKILQIPLQSDSVIKIIGELRELNQLKVEPYEFSPHIVQALKSPNLNIKKLSLVLSRIYFNNDFINSISTLKNVTELKLNSLYNPNVDILILLLQKLPNIHTLYFCLYKLHDLDGINKSRANIIKTIVQHANKLSKLTFLSLDNQRRFFQIKPKLFFPIDEINYFDILELVENRCNRIKLTIEFIFRTSKIVSSKYPTESQSIHILNMVPDLLTIEFRTVLHVN